MAILVCGIKSIHHPLISPPFPTGSRLFFAVIGQRERHTFRVDRIHPQSSIHSLIANLPSHPPRAGQPTTLRNLLTFSPQHAAHSLRGAAIQHCK